jgi:hypothetical protein
MRGIDRLGWCCVALDNTITSATSLRHEDVLTINDVADCVDVSYDLSLVCIIIVALLTPAAGGTFSPLHAAFKTVIHLTSGNTQTVTQAQAHNTRRQHTHMLHLS